MAKRKRNPQSDNVEQDQEHELPEEMTEDKPVVAGEDEQDEEEPNFEDLGLDARLVRALSKKLIAKPTPIQRVAVPLILEGKDVVARAKTGSGKTLAYLLPLLQKLFADSPSKKNLAPSAFILVPTRELCQQVYGEIVSLIESCRVQLKVVQLRTMMSPSDLVGKFVYVNSSLCNLFDSQHLAGLPHIVVSTPACVHTCLKNSILQSKALQESLSVLVLDEADLLLSYGYEDDLKALTAHVPKCCQCILMSATSSDDVEKLKKLVLHNPYILTLPEVGGVKDDIIPRNVQQYYISCSARDKLIYILALLKLDTGLQKKMLIFANSIDMGFRLKLFLEQIGIKSAVLNSELPQNSRLHILEQFNHGLFDYLIATDTTKSVEEQNDKESHVPQKKSKNISKRKLDAEFGVVRGLDFKNVHTVVNFDMPKTAAGYVHRIGRTGRAYNTGASVSLVSAEEMEIFEEIKSVLGENESEDSKFIAPFRKLRKEAVENLRYRAESVARSVTKIAVRESRAQVLRDEILNSEKLKAHFQDNPKDLDLLKHDKVLSKTEPAPHLRHVPEYLLDPTTQEACKIVKLARAAMGNPNSNRRKGFNGKSHRSRDPLKTFSAKGPKRGRKGGMRRKGQNKDDAH